MVNFRYGPVELYLVGFADDRPDRATMRAFANLLTSGQVRLLDFVLVSRADDGSLTVTEIEEDLDEYGLGGFELDHVGIAGEEDIAELAELIPAGTSAGLVSLELSYARTLAEKIAESGSLVLRTERIPAPIVNAVADLAESA